jgi:hypothetical protein
VRLSFLEQATERDSSPTSAPTPEQAAVIFEHFFLGLLDGCYKVGIVETESTGIFFEGINQASELL